MYLTPFPHTAHMPPTSFRDVIGFSLLQNALIGRDVGVRERSKDSSFLETASALQKDGGHNTREHSGIVFVFSHCSFGAFFG